MPCQEDLERIIEVQKLIREAFEDQKVQEFQNRSVKEEIKSLLKAQEGLLKEFSEIKEKDGRFKG